MAVACPHLVGVPLLFRDALITSNASREQR
jgi:hypothetical protein